MVLGTHVLEWKWQNWSLSFSMHSSHIMQYIQFMLHFGLKNGKIAQLMYCNIIVRGSWVPQVCNFIALAFAIYVFTQFYCFFNVFRNFSQIFVCTKKFFKILPQIASISYLKTTVSCALYTYSKTLEYHLNSRSVQE